ncbi:MAG TPA: acyltransferase [Bryobacteraceae bacterium]|nr:acyltransferase [Bryobacteraceae bacterium]
MTSALARPARSAHLPALTGLRFFLALWVIVNHLIGTGHIYEPVALMLPGPLQAIMRGGYQAVPTFFVLSGFVLARNYSSTPWRPVNVWKYLVGRFARVYPVYLLSLLIVLPFIVKAKDQPKGWLVAMHLTLTQGWWSGHYTAGWNTPAWSLSCEMFFYLIFPLLIIPMKDAGWVRTIGAALLACVMTQAMWAVGISDQLKPVIHLSDFLMGIAVARAFDLLTERRAAPQGKWLYGMGILGSAAILGYAQFLPKSISMNTFLRPMNGLLLLGLGLGGGWIARALSTRPVVFLGKASYGMYILHIPILWWAVSWPDFAVRYLYVAFVVAVSCIVYAVFEEPANRLIRSMAGKPNEARRDLKTFEQPVRIAWNVCSAAPSSDPRSPVSASSASHASPPPPTSSSN